MNCELPNQLREAIESAAGVEPRRPASVIRGYKPPGRVAVRNLTLRLKELLRNLPSDATVMEMLDALEDTE